MLTSAEYESMHDTGRVTFDHGPRIRIFAGWYQHTIVYVDGKEAGRIQRKRQFKRETYSTSSGNAVVMGIDPRWAVSWYLSQV